MSYDDWFWWEVPEPPEPERGDWGSEIALAILITVLIMFLAYC